MLCTEDGVGEQVAYWLTSAGVPTSIARSGYEARTRVLAGTVRLLVTDRVLPPWPGLDTIVSLKRSIAALTVACLGDGVPDNHSLALSAGADIILPCPLRRFDVLAAFKTADPSARRLQCAS